MNWGRHIHLLHLAESLWFSSPEGVQGASVCEGGVCMVCSVWHVHAHVCMCALQGLGFLGKPGESRALWNSEFAPGAVSGQSLLFASGLQGTSNWMDGKD